MQYCRQSGERLGESFQLKTMGRGGGGAVRSKHSLGFTNYLLFLKNKIFNQQKSANSPTLSSSTFICFKAVILCTFMYGRTWQLPLMNKNNEKTTFCCFRQIQTSLCSGPYQLNMFYLLTCGWKMYIFILKLGLRLQYQYIRNTFGPDNPDNNNTIADSGFTITVYCTVCWKLLSDWSR